MKCKICEKEFYKGSNLTRHINKVYEKNGQIRKHSDTQRINKPLQNIKDLDEEEDSELWTLEVTVF